MRYFRLAAVFMVVGFASCANAEGGCPPWRPCGPGNSWGGNRCILQGFYGADFRPACQCHDECLAAGTPRYLCDRQFRDNMYCACECSTNPRACRRKARCYYAAARIFGGIWH